MGDAGLATKVANYWCEGSGWKWSLLQMHLLAVDMVRVASTCLGSGNMTGDRVGWLDPRSTKFTMRDAYKFAAYRGADQGWVGWNLIWRLKLQQKVKVFVRVMAHEKLLTNEERWKRRMGASSICGRCLEREEGILHAIRDCKSA